MNTLSTRIVSLAMAIVGSGSVLADDLPPIYPEHPWPMAGKDAQRTNRTTTIGPRNPEIAWSIQFDTYRYRELHESQPALDRSGRIHLRTVHGTASVDEATRRLVWTYEPGVGEMSDASLLGDRLVWGDHGLYGFLYCVDIASGIEVWREQFEWITASPAVDDSGLVYIADQNGIMAARWIDDGSEFWTVTDDNQWHNSSPSLRWPEEYIVSGGDSARQVLARDALDGSPLWTFNSSGWGIMGHLPIEGDVVYHATFTGGTLHAVNVLTGEQEWEFPVNYVNRGAIAVGHNGVIYTGTAGGRRPFFAISPDGEELWQWTPPGDVMNPPTIGGDGTIYVTSYEAVIPYRGWVHALNPDGTELWTVEMGEECQTICSPTIAPDGTLYVTGSNGFLYALHDPPNPALSLSLDACPGPATLTLTGLSPDGRAAIVFSRNRGRLDVTSGGCEGALLYLDPPSARLVQVVRADGNGEAIVTGFVPAGACYGYLQVLDLDSCHVSNVVLVE